MNLGQNKFFIGFGAVVLLGSLVLGYLLYQSSSDFENSSAEYNKNVAELQRLQNLPLYPEASNLKILEEQKVLAHEATIALHQKLVPMAFPLEPTLTPEQFQDRLNTSVKTLVEKAAQKGVKLSDKFYLGFGEYRTATPRPKAAPALGRQLKCIELAVDTMLEENVTSIGEISRTRLEDEVDPAKLGITPAATPKPAHPDLLSKYPFEIQFVAEQKAFQMILNDLSKTEKQFFIVRPLLIKNQSEKAPKKNDPNADRTSEITSAGGAKADKMRYVLGAEKVNVTLRIDSVVFTGNLPK